MKRRPSRFAGPLAAMGIKRGLVTAASRAKAIGCSRSHLLHCERGACLPGVELLARMAQKYRAAYANVEVAAHQCVVRLERGVA